MVSGCLIIRIQNPSRICSHPTFFTTLLENCYVRIHFFVGTVISCYSLVNPNQDPKLHTFDVSLFGHVILSKRVTFYQE